VFTVEQNARGARYLVRPVVYCDPTQATYFDTSLFTFNEPDAWPIAGDGVVQGAPFSPLAGRFEASRARLNVVSGGTCLAQGTSVEVGPAPAAPTLFDGGWNVTLAEHDHGPVGEVVDFYTRGEGTLLTGDWGVYDGGPMCLVLRTGLNMLVGRDGSFGVTINGNQLNSEGLTLNVEGRFISSNVAEGTYTVTGNPLDCTGAPVSFTAVFASAYAPPKPSTGQVTLFRPKNGAGPGGGEKPPEGGECKDLSSVSPAFKRLEKAEIKLASFSVRSLPIAVTGSVSVGSVGICDRAINAIEPRLEVTPPSLGLTAAFDFKGHSRDLTPSYSLAPFGWHVPEGSGAPRPEAPTIDWSLAVNRGVELAPTFDFGVNPLAKPGERLQPELELIKVPVNQPTATLIALGRPILEASIGPELSVSMKIDREQLEKLVKEGEAEGESPQAAGEQVAEQARVDIQGAIDAEEGIAAPAEAAPADAASVAGAVSDDMAASLVADAAAAPGEEGLSAILIEGLADPALAADAEEVAGDLVVTVVEAAAFEARARRPLPPGLERSRGRLVLAGQLPARPVPRIHRRSLRRARFPVARIPALVRDTLSLPVPARVGPLVTTSRHLRPGGRVSVIAPFLAGGAPHDALLTLAGPGYRATRLLRIARGAAGATIRLPRRMSRGTWTISIEDLSGVALAPQGHTLTGAAIVRMGVFAVR
jgi:hypothetical protein